MSKLLDNTFEQYRKAIMEGRLPVIDQLRMIVDQKQAMPVKFDDGQTTVDLFSASAMVKVYDAVNDQNKEKIKNMISTKGGLLKYQSIAFKLLESQESKREEKKQLAEARATKLFDLASNIRFLPGVEDIISINYLTDGISVFARTVDGNAYEFEVRAAPYAKGHQDKRLKEPAFGLTERNKAAKIALKPKDLRGPDDDGMIDRPESEKDVQKSIKAVADRYNVEVVKDFEEYTKPNAVKESDGTRDVVGALRRDAATMLRGGLGKERVIKELQTKALNYGVSVENAVQLAKDLYSIEAKNLKM